MIEFHGRWRIVVVSPSGLVRVDREWDNLVTDEGENHILEDYLYTPTRYVGLLKSGTPNVNWTASDVTGNQVTSEYSGAHKTFTPNGLPSGGSISNSSSPAAFSMVASVTVTGAYLGTTSSKSPVGGRIYAAGTFGSESVVSGETVKITATFTAA